MWIKIVSNSRPTVKHVTLVVLTQHEQVMTALEAFFFSRVSHTKAQAKLGLPGPGNSCLTDTKRRRKFLIRLFFFFLIIGFCQTYSKLYFSYKIFISLIRSLFINLKVCNIHGFKSLLIYCLLFQFMIRPRLTQVLCPYSSLRSIITFDVNVNFIMSFVPWFRHK